MNKTASIIIVIALAIALGIIFIGGSKSNSNSKEAVLNSEIKDGVQYVKIKARGGYTPQVSLAKGDIPTKLVVSTEGAFDCSVALVIRSIGYQKILPQTGEEIIDLGIPKKGDSIEGVCSMGMYNFVINFS